MSILYCKPCDKWTMKEACSCGAQTTHTRPAPYSPGKFATYRRKARREELEKKGLL